MAKALFFDVNETLLDLQPLEESVSEALGGRRELLPLWFRMMLHYSLVATVGEEYRDFGEIGAAVLIMLARREGTEIDPDQARRALLPLRSLPPHPDVAPGLQALKKKGYRLYTLTNSSKDGVRSQMEHAGLSSFFDEILSVEAVQIFKPHVHVYKWAVRRIGLQPMEAMMVAAHGWDVAGAAWAGMQTAFVSRPGQQIYPLAEAPDIVVKDILHLSERL